MALLPFGSMDLNEKFVCHGSNHDQTDKLHKLPAIGIGLDT